MYEAHKWKIGEEITSDKLNHIEKGIEEAGLPREITDPQDGQTLKYDAAKGKWVNGEGGSGTLVVNGTTDESSHITLDKTWKEIADAFPNAYIHITSEAGEDYYIINYVGSGANPIAGTTDYVVSFTNVSGQKKTLGTDSETGYPTNAGGIA